MINANAITSCYGISKTIRASGRGSADRHTFDCIEISKLCGSKYDRRLDVNRRVYSVDGCCPTLETCEGGGRKKKIAYCVDNIGDSDVIVRRLTPRECWRLMDFDDTDFDKAQSVVSNSQLYKQAGNSIVVSVLYYIFKELF